MRIVHRTQAQARARAREALGSTHPEALAEAGWHCEDRIWGEALCEALPTARTVKQAVYEHYGDGQMPEAPTHDAHRNRVLEEVLGASAVRGPHGLWHLPEAPGHVVAV